MSIPMNTPESGEALNKFAVMRYMLSSKNMRFKSLHETEADALAEARRLTGELIAKVGTSLNTCYYVIQIIDAVGVVKGRLQQGGR